MCRIRLGVEMSNLKNVSVIECTFKARSDFSTKLSAQLGVELRNLRDLSGRQSTQRTSCFQYT